MRPSAESGYNWKSPAFESLMDEASKQASIEERYKILAQAEKVLLDYYLVTPLDVTTSRHLVKPTVKGWDDNILDTHPSKLMSIGQ
jgi:oligopeptide transport system substrate-binding protein